MFPVRNWSFSQRTVRKSIDSSLFTQPNLLRKCSTIISIIQLCSHVRCPKTIEHSLRVAGPLWEGYHKRRGCSSDTYPDLSITKDNSRQQLRRLRRLERTCPTGDTPRTPSIETCSIETRFQGSWSKFQGSGFRG